MLTEGGREGNFECNGHIVFAPGFIHLAGFHTRTRVSREGPLP